MPAQPDPELQRQVNETFETFRQSLQQMLSAEATQHVGSTLKRLGAQGGPFRVEDARVEVVISDLKLSAVGDAQPAGPESRSERQTKRRRRGTDTSTPSSTRKRSRAKTSVREAMLAAFEDEGAQLDTAQLRERLQQAGVKTSVDNVHQQLRRLVQSGELAREGRGVYRRTGHSARAA